MSLLLHVLLVCWVCVHRSRLLALLSAVLRLLLAACAHRQSDLENFIICEWWYSFCPSSHLGCLTPVGLLLWS